MTQKIFRILAILFYLFIILKGEMIGQPFFSWLLFTLFDFDNIDQPFAFLGVLGLVIACRNHTKTRTAKVLTVDIICFLLLVLPIARRMTAVPIELFNYIAFLLPAALFAIFYIVSLFLGCRQFFQMKKDSSG